MMIAAGVRYRETEVLMTCNKDVPVGVPKFTNKDADSCVYHFEWELAGACPPSVLQCTAIGMWIVVVFMKEKGLNSPFYEGAKV